MRVETQLVSVPAVITNGSGRPLAGLRRENFQLFEDGQPQSIANFGTTETPFEIALFLDTSGSTRADVALIRQAANSFISALRPGDRVAIVAFNTEASRRYTRLPQSTCSLQLTGDRKLLQRAIESLGPRTELRFMTAWNALWRTVFREPASEDVRGRRAVVALTDGVDSTSDTDFAAARGKAYPRGSCVLFHSSQHGGFRGRSVAERLPG